MQRIPGGRQKNGNWAVKGKIDAATTRRKNAAERSSQSYHLIFLSHKRHTSFLFVVVDLPFGRSWALADLDQSDFTICSSIEDFLSCREKSLSSCLFLFHVKQSNVLLSPKTQHTEELTCLHLCCTTPRQTVGRVPQRHRQAQIPAE